jgi:NTE family protein
MTETSMLHPADAVFEGGGVKGIALLGAVSVMEKVWKWENVAGTSAGAIVAAFLAAGMNAQEIRGVLDRIDLRELMDPRAQGSLLGKATWPLRFVPGLRTIQRYGGYALKVYHNFGLYKGDRFVELVNQNLPQGVRTFGDLLYDATLPKDSPYRYKLRVIASDVTANRMLILPQDIRHFGRDPDELTIAEALRMSMSIPVFFEPWRIKGVKGKTHLIVDGGILSNFPVWLFDAPPGETPSWPTIGFELFSPADKNRVPGFPPDVDELGNVVQYGSNIWNTVFSFIDRQYIAERHWARTVAIDNLGVSTTQFDLSEEQKNALWESGAKAAREFMKEWGAPDEGFENWKRKYRGEVEAVQRQGLENPEMVT